MTLAQNIHQLIRTHVIENGYGGYTPNEPLLAQLRAMIGNSVGTSRGRGSGQGGLVISAAAIDLDTEISRDAIIHQDERTGTRWCGTLNDLLNEWATIDDPEWTPFLETLTNDWVTRINALFEQRKPPMRPSIPCPSCGQRFHGEERDQCLWVDVWDHGNDTMAAPGNWTAGCDGCGATWEGDNLKWFVAATRLTTSSGT